MYSLISCRNLRSRRSFLFHMSHVEAAMECPENYQWSKEYSFLISFTPGPSVLSAMWWEKMDNFSKMSCTLLNIPQVSIHSRQFKSIFDVKNFVRISMNSSNPNRWQKISSNITYVVSFWKCTEKILFSLISKINYLDAKHEKNCKKQPRLFLI